MKLPVTKKSQGNQLSTPYPSHNIINRFFDEGFFRPFSMLDELSNTMDRQMQVWSPSVDIKEKKDGFHIKANLPGVSEKNIDLEVDGNTLILSGHLEEEKEEDGDTWYRSECRVGDFRRAFELPRGADLDAVDAKVKHGVIRITVPKKAEAQKKKINVVQDA